MQAPWRLSAEQNDLAYYNDNRAEDDRKRASARKIAQRQDLTSRSEVNIYLCRAPSSLSISRQSSPSSTASTLRK